MAHDCLTLESGIGREERSKNADEACVLRIRVRHLICPLEFDAYGEVVAALTAGPPRGTGMPGAPVEGHELHTGARTVDEYMRRDTNTTQRVVFGCEGKIESIAEQGLDMVRTKTAGRQAYAMNHGEFHVTGLGACVLMGRHTLPYPLESMFADAHDQSLACDRVIVLRGRGEAGCAAPCHRTIRKVFRHELNLVDVQEDVRLALAEDVGAGDLTARLVPPERLARARVITREPGVFCGRPWVDATFEQIDAGLEVVWHVADGDTVAPEQVLFELRGPARAILTGERTALNFVQLLSGVATTTRHHVDAMRTAAPEGMTPPTLVDTRKTVPGLRRAQKYAVVCGGAANHRMGLFDAFLVKENHILAAGGIAEAVAAARAIAPNAPVEIEVETLDELDQALAAGAEIIMLDEFDAGMRREAVQRTDGRARLEVSGGVELDAMGALAASGVDYVSVGALTKHVRALDLSLRIVGEVPA